jgi:putative endonuclease
MASHNDLGTKGEALAQEHLIENGFQILDTNWRHNRAELDIVCRKNNELIVVEVKTRSNDFFQSPEEGVTFAKEKHLIRGAEAYIEANDIELDCRFDVISIVLNDKGHHLNHIENAFTPTA